MLFIILSLGLLAALFLYAGVQGIHVNEVIRKWIAK